METLPYRLTHARNLSHCTALVSALSSPRLRRRRGTRPSAAWYHTGSDRMAQAQRAYAQRAMTTRGIEHVETRGEAAEFSGAGGDIAPDDGSRICGDAGRH